MVHIAEGGERVDQDIEWMAQRLHPRKASERPILFLGSRTGKLFRPSPFLCVLNAYRTHTQDLLAMSPITRFHECYNILCTLRPEELSKIVEYAFEQKHVEVGDVCITELVKRDIFPMIITTNIGNELEYAFTQANIQNFEMVHPQQMSRISFNANIPLQVLKIFGSRHEYTVSRRQAHLERYPQIKAIFEQIQDRNMLVVGFDEVWDRHVQPLLFTRRGGELWYVNEEKPKENTFLSLSLQEQDDVYIFRIEYDLFFLSLCWYIFGEIPTTYQFTYNKFTQIESILQTINDTQEANRQHVSRLLHLISAPL